jgi:Zn-finger nucleic acid-binding protein
MNARTSGGVIIDHCPSHGVWLDRGELGRVMGDPIVNELGKLREHLGALEPSPEVLAEMRERWAAEQEQRTRLAAIERKRIEQERVKREAEAADAAAKREDTLRADRANKLAIAERLATTRREAAAREDARRNEAANTAAQQRIEADRAAIAEAQRERTERTKPPQPTTEPTMLVEQRQAEARARAARQNRIDELTWTRDQARRHVDWLLARIDSLHLELASTKDRLASAREGLAEADSTLERALQEAE